MTVYSIPPLLTLLSFAGLGIFTFIFGKRTRINLYFSLICLLGGIMYIDILIIFNVKSAHIALISSRIGHVFYILLFPFFLLFFHEYLGIKRKWMIRTAYGFAFILMFTTPTSLCIESMQKFSFGYFGKGGVLYPLIGLAAAVMTLYILKQVYNEIIAEKNSHKKNRLKYVFAGFGIMGLMTGLNVLPILGYPIYPPGNFSFIPLFIFSIGIFKHNLLDMSIILKKSLLYSILTALLTGLYALIIIIADRLLKGFGLYDSSFFPVIFFLFIALLFGPLKTWVQKIIDRVFAKESYEYQTTLRQVSRTIASMLDFDKIARLLLDTVSQAMKVDNCSLFIYDPVRSGYFSFATRGKYYKKTSSILISQDSWLVRHMKKTKQPLIKNRLGRGKKGKAEKNSLKELILLEAEIIIPMIFNDKLNGFAILGNKSSGNFYSDKDIYLFEILADQSALAIENAKSCRIINKLNKNLEKKVRQRTIDLEKALKEKERTQEQLIRSESLAAMGQLVAGVAHELNNPLTSVKSLVQATIEDLVEWDLSTPPDENLIDDLVFADKELSRARSIVASLLGLSRQTQEYSEAVNLNLAVKDALRVLHNQYKYSQINIIEEYGFDLPEIQGNFANLGQVFLNLIKNAIQAVGEQNGEIILKTWFDPEQEHVVFECQDNGPGIPDAVRKDIFKPFFTTKSVGVGTGLGLYLCHEIIQKHGGTISIENQTEENRSWPGACFIVRLPLNFT